MLCIFIMKGTVNGTTRSHSFIRTHEILLELFNAVIVLNNTLLKLSLSTHDGQIVDSEIAVESEMRDALIGHDAQI